MLFFLTIQYFNETFENDQPNNKWNIIGESEKLEIAQCSASFQFLIRNCLHVNNTDKRFHASAEMKTEITSTPFLVQFTAKTQMPTTGSLISLSMLNGEESEVELTLTYSDDDPQYAFIDSSQNKTIGNITHERDLTHHITLVVNTDNTYYIYANGIILKGGVLSKPIKFPLNKVELLVENGNTTSQIGNIIVTSDIKDRYPLLISTFLQFRQIERLDRLRVIVDAEEMRLFDGTPIDEPLDREDEYGVPLEFSKADPRNFNFPFKLERPKERLSKLKEAQRPSTLDKRMQKKDFDPLANSETQERAEL
ncbi:hypothetical protein TVAG_335540 [Trichomonas vaginalis G3]|uniref:Uncharacterized protein n=1 Tax=Trichomonas vaginalis (strain ATCC PRA-98 / G3) TaxID=412133 RepID=A2FC81_TRIV3|nr:hypothetical protein TVAGG3_0147900 [Trichomonas vaginalis G3]EAX97494.1 hypothetical protein TVAG_335540 [Trichomonas vaginalis G3]KAI5547064.1 hypothetical protein TVAGG3_0147900 [Trichomonas vaginalis G3]|eukprot:XP_001310424.1 hypothetical protein [Trichomonas vaginalis G3]